MIRQAELAKARKAIFASTTEGLFLDNAESRHAIQLIDLVDRLVDADIVIGACEIDDPRMIAAETDFDTALGALLTLVKTARETPPPAKEAPQPCSSL